MSDRSRNYKGHDNYDGYGGRDGDYNYGNSSNHGSPGGARSYGRGSDDGYGRGRSFSSGNGGGNGGSSFSGGGDRRSWGRLSGRQAAEGGAHAGAYSSGSRAASSRAVQREGQEQHTRDRSMQSHRSIQSARGSYGTRGFHDAPEARNSRGFHDVSEAHGASDTHNARDAHNTHNTHNTRDASASQQGASRGHAAARNAKPPRKKSVAKRVVIALLVLLTLAGVGAAVYINIISGNLHRGVTQDVRDALVKTEYSKEPFYMLLMGTDESAERSADESYGGSFRSDSMMLARIDCPNKKVTLVSLERDTLVDMGSNGYQKLNAASAIGGPAYAIEMVSKMAHNTPISHYALIDFDGFCEVVDALGGIDVDVPIEIDDDDAGGYLAAGQQTLTGEQALILCRSRHAYEEYGSGNAYRSANQRLVLSAIAQKILASDVATIASTVGTLSKYLQTDLGINDIIGLAQALRGLDMSSDMYTAMQPTTSLYEGDMWYNISDEPEWQEMLTRVDEGLPPTETDVVDATGTVLATTGSGETLGGSQANEYLNKKSGTVVVRNGGAPAGSGGKAGEAIEAMGYTTDIANANSDDFEETLVIYKTADQRADAMEIARVVGKGRAVQNDGSYIMNGDFLVVLGSDYGA